MALVETILPLLKDGDGGGGQRRFQKDLKLYSLQGYYLINNAGGSPLTSAILGGNMDVITYFLNWIDQEVGTEVRKSMLRTEAIEWPQKVLNDLKVCTHSLCLQVIRNNGPQNLARLIANISSYTWSGDLDYQAYLKLAIVEDAIDTLITLSRGNIFFKKGCAHLMLRHNRQLNVPLPAAIDYGLGDIALKIACYKAWL